MLWKTGNRFMVIGGASAALVGLMSTWALATDLSNNLSATTAGAETAAGTRRLTASFATDASTHVLNSVTLLMASAAGGTATLELYTGVGLEPATLVTTLTSPSSYPATAGQAMFTAEGVTLAANTTYWVVLRATSGTFSWSWAGSNTGAGTGFQHVWGLSEDTGDSWWTGDLYPLQMSVVVDSCVSPSITSAPTGVTVLTGNAVALSGAGSGSATLGYSWLHGTTLVVNGAGGASAGGGSVSGAGTAALSIAGAQPSDGGQYTMVVTNSCGSASSDAATVVVGAQCGPADVAAIGGSAGADSQLTVDDLVFYLAAFFDSNVAIADLASLGGAATPDGQITVDDLVAYLAAFFAGCP
ncbi:MAG: choice-of-anchor R domain-containing protein [Phycisphaerales bacterium]